MTYEDEEYEFDPELEQIEAALGMTINESVLAFFSNKSSGAIILHQLKLDYYEALTSMASCDITDTARLYEHKVRIEACRRVMTAVAFANEKTLEDRQMMNEADQEQLRRIIRGEPTTLKDA